MVFEWSQYSHYAMTYRDVVTQNHQNNFSKRVHLHNNNLARNQNLLTPGENYVFHILW